MAKSKLSPVAPMKGPTDGGYSSVSCRKIDNGWVVSQYSDEGGSSEVYHADKPDLSSSGKPGREMGSSLSKAVKVAKG